MQEYEARGSVFVSFVLEMKDKESFVDNLVDVVVCGAPFDPLPLKSSRMMLAMTNSSQHLKEYFSLVILIAIML